ncbi:MAG: hypothetical protein WC750_05000 [Patescibacteria group bacterium]
MSEEELRAEFESLQDEFEQADRLAAPLLAICWAEEDEDINLLDLN